MSESDPYLLGYRKAEQERLERQADELALDSERLFDEIGVRDGWRVGEMGCGPRGCLELLNDYVSANGIDRTIGLRVPRMLRDAGLRDVHIHPLVHIYPFGHGRRYLITDFVENARSRVLEQGLISEPDLDALIRSMPVQLENPDTLVTSSLFIQTWGRKP